MNQHPMHELMLEAIALSRNAFGRTAPNPCVGALLVKDGQVVARGWHKAAGQEHAEVAALKNAAARGVNPAECTMLVTLEPCNHYGKTPPCTKAILEAGVRHVVIGAADPTPEASGGADFLRAQGVNVESGIAERECLDNIADFLVWRHTERPYVILKLASTLDGRIATGSGHSKWISGPETLQRVHELRSRVQAVLIGGNTFYQDNPQLTCRLESAASRAQLNHPAESGCTAAVFSRENSGSDNFCSNPDGTAEAAAAAESACRSQPLAVIITSRLPENCASFHLLQQRPADVIFWTSTALAASPRAEALRRAGAQVVGLEYANPGKAQAGNAGALGRAGSQGRRLDLAAALAHLRQERGVYHILCEGGGRLGLTLLESGLADEFRLHLSPKILGDNEASPLFNGRSPHSMDEALQMRFAGYEPCGEDLLLRLRKK